MVLKEFQQMFISAFILIIFSACYINCACGEGEICDEKIIRMPIVNTLRSYYYPQQQYQTQCGPYQCMNGGRCQNNPYNNQPTCMCQAPYYGNRCEFGSQPHNFLPQTHNFGPQSHNIHQQSNDLCRVFNDRNMNICQNGGKCVFVADGKVACICPTTHKGLFCELPVYLPCNGDPSKICHRDHGVCAPNGTCICEEGYAGPRCDKVEACKTGYCLNGATCQEIDVDPYRNCTCQPNYFGRRCELFGIKFPNGTFIQFNRACNLTLSIFNQGGYTAFYKVEWIDVFGKRASVSSGTYLAGQTWKTVIPFYAQNLVVTMTTSNGIIIHIDRSLPSDLPCQKCYKIWGALPNPQWDYINC